MVEEEMEEEEATRQLFEKLPLHEQLTSLMIATALFVNYGTCHQAIPLSLTAAADLLGQIH